MKLIIDTPNTQYNNIMEVKSMSLGRIPYKGIIMNAIRGIQNGTPIPDNATNGDVIKAMFPNLEIEYTDIDEYTNKPRYVKLIVGNTIITRMSADRWNALYQKGGKE